MCPPELVSPFGTIIALPFFVVDLETMPLLFGLLATHFLSGLIAPLVLLSLVFIELVLLASRRLHL
jgi:hypothetical protein